MRHPNHYPAKLPNALVFDPQPKKRAETLYGRLVARVAAIALDVSLLGAYVTEARALPEHERIVWLGILMEKLPDDMLTYPNLGAYYSEIFDTFAMLRQYYREPANRNVQFLLPTLLAAPDPKKELDAGNHPEWVRYYFQELYNYATAQA